MQRVQQNLRLGEEADNMAESNKQITDFILSAGELCFLMAIADAPLAFKLE